jgi:hypothetical protein
MLSGFSSYLEGGQPLEHHGRIRVFFAIVAISFSLSHWASAQSPAEDLLRAQQAWHINCMQKGCLASVDILRGESGDPPNPSNSDEFISVTVGVDRNSHRPSVLIFEVDPHADKQAGVDLLFARTVTDGKDWRLALDTNGSVHLLFQNCKTACTAVIGGGTPDEQTMKLCSNFVTRMQSDNHLFVLYTRNGHSYRTAVSLALFKEAYASLLNRVSEPFESSSGDKESAPH